MFHTYALIACIWLITLVGAYFLGIRKSLSDLKYLQQQEKEDLKRQALEKMEIDDLVSALREYVKREDWNNCIKVRDILNKRGVTVNL